MAVSAEEPAKATSKPPSKTSKSTSNRAAQFAEGGLSDDVDLSKAVKAAFPDRLEP
jgi:hypothetical protein